MFDSPQLPFKMLVKFTSSAPTLQGADEVSIEREAKIHESWETESGFAQLNIE